MQLQLAVQIYTGRHRHLLSEGIRQQTHMAHIRPTQPPIPSGILPTDWYGIKMSWVMAFWHAAMQVWHSNNFIAK